MRDEDDCKCDLIFRGFRYRILHLVVDTRIEIITHLRNRSKYMDFWVRTKIERENINI